MYVANTTQAKHKESKWWITVFLKYIFYYSYGRCSVYCNKTAVAHNQETYDSVCFVKSATVNLLIRESTCLKSIATECVCACVHSASAPAGIGNVVAGCRARNGAERMHSAP